MTDDDDLCLCFHVTRRKVIQYIRVHRPQKASQLSECYGAGTGCGWCRPFLTRLLESERPETETLPDIDAYASKRAQYREQENKR
ncbi:NAD(P)H-nitrite reductase large subunit [Rhodopirellula rubra]|uniref:NAD(P)H-nitrite reductase large subunit n=2 Tax=Pirellulaceae TaxID=2691357 RepID=A0A7W5E151_9BACT|nr:(2Fe-2S)-binding protein [Aporhodopirellula rubra]MBB3208200.1 NAD(P)H-nitrite reductase large subunit [Aporhodopirellula rubra]